MKGADNFCRVVATRPGDHVAMLTDPLLDPRMAQAAQGLARGRGATFISYMGDSTRYVTASDEAKALLERVTFVVSTWFASGIDPFCMALRNRGRHWVKIAFVRDLDVLRAPQAQLPMELLGEIIRATSRLLPENGDFALRATDSCGTDFRTPRGGAKRNRRNRRRGRNVADGDGCYVHCLPTHGANLFEPGMVGLRPEDKIGPAGFDGPFETPVSVEFRDNVVHAVHGDGVEAEVLRDYLMGGTPEEAGCGHDPKAPRFDVNSTGPNAPGAPHFGISASRPSPCLRRVMPDREELHIHMDLVIHDGTVTAGNHAMIEDDYLFSLDGPAVPDMVKRRGGPMELLEACPL